MSSCKSVRTRSRKAAEILLRKQNYFDNDQILDVRNMPIVEALNRMCWHWKEDADFKPVKDSTTRRLYVSVGATVTELLVTCPKWFDVRSKVGGGGAIDLIIHLQDVNFSVAMKLLRLGACKVSSHG